MTVKSIEISDSTYAELMSLKLANETWDDFVLRLLTTIKKNFPSDSEWKNAYTKAFNENRVVFEKLAE